MFLTHPRALSLVSPTPQAELSSYGPSAPRPAARPRQARRNPLASMYKALIKLDPQQMPKQTWEIIACLNECVHRSLRSSRC
jgi:hypothetical protein